MTRFVAWYNTEHRDSGIRYVTIEDKHFGREGALLARRPCASPPPNLAPAVQALKRIG